jgi:hypothetical protein
MQDELYVFYEGTYGRILHASSFCDMQGERYEKGVGFVPCDAVRLKHKGTPISKAAFQQGIKALINGKS